MSLPPLAGRCSRILIDVSVLADGSGIGNLLAELDQLAQGRQVSLFFPSESLAAEVCPQTLDAIIGDRTDDGIAALDRVHSGESLHGTLLVTSSERRLSWARRRRLAVLDPAGLGDLVPLLSPANLTIRDTVSLILEGKKNAEKSTFLIAVNGIDNSGKTVFSDNLSSALAALGFRIRRVSLEAFTAPKKLRKKKDYSDAERLYRKHYAMDRLKEQLLSPLRNDLPVHFDVYDPSREKVVEKRSIETADADIIILEGPFLFQTEIFPFFDFRIYLVTDFESALQIELDNVDAKDRKRIEEDFVKVRLGAQSIYLRQETPWKRAHLVIRGANIESPVIEAASEFAASTPQTEQHIDFEAV